MSDIAHNNRFAPVYGLEPRYWRERRANPQPQAMETVLAPPKSVILWYPEKSARPMDGDTRELRRRVLEAEPEDWRVRPIVVLPILLGVSACLWLAAGKITLLVGNAFGLF
jgi:hypothetical protein